jgi:hypothetical protein
MTKTILLITSVLLTGACSKADAPVADNAATEASRSQDVPERSEVNAASQAQSAPSAPAYTLAGNGLSPGLAFGTAQAEAVAAAAKAFGPAGKLEHNGDCGEGAMDFVSFNDFQLGFQEGKLAGWTLNGKAPALKTAEGITIGTPRKALGKVEIDEESTLGPEFSIDEVGGILGKDGKVEALWAGLPCQFR